MGIKNIQSWDKEQDKPLTMDLNQRMKHWNLTQRNHKEHTPASMARELCLATMLTTITLAHLLVLPLTIEPVKHTTSSYLDGNLPRSTIRHSSNSENKQSRTKNKSI